MKTAEVGTDLEKVAAFLRDDQLVGIPTETVYGLAGNALHVAAVTKIFKVKNRPHFDPLIVHVPDLASASKYVHSIPAPAAKLAEQFWPGPLTLLLPKKEVIPDLVTSGLDRVGIRSPNHPLTRELLSILEFPLAAPSANPFGYVSPTQASHVAEQLGTRIPYILDGGPCRLGLESTVIGFDGAVAVIYRLGGLNVEDIEKVVGEVRITTHSSSDPRSPGQLISHYAPGKRLMLGNLDEMVAHFDMNRTALLSYRSDRQVPYQFVLSPTGDIDEAAKNLFLALRVLEKYPVDLILAERAPDVGLGRAINDRLVRASVK